MTAREHIADAFSGCASTPTLAREAVTDPFARAMTRRDAGLADEYWKQYYTPDEVDEIVANRTTTMFSSGQYPIHVGLFVNGRDAPTVLMGHGLFVYGLALAHL